MTTTVHLIASTPMLEALADGLNTSGGLQRLEVFSSARPATGDAPLSDPMFTAPFPASPASVVGGLLTLSGPGASVLVLEGGTPVWARLYGGDGQARLDLKARLSSTPDDPADPAHVVVGAVTLSAGAIVRATVGTIQLPF